SASFSSDGQRVVTASDDTTARIWDPAVGVEHLGMRDGEGPAGGAGWSPQGNRILTRARGTVEVWAALSGTKVLTPPAQQTLIEDARWNLDGSRILTVGTTGITSTVTVWDATTGARLPTYSAPGESLVAAATSPDGSGRVLGLGQAHAYVWDAIG